MDAVELAVREARQDARRKSFDDAAADYDRFRVSYPDALFDELARQLPPPARVLEIASGTGHATLPLAQRGYQLHCIELGEKLAGHARNKLAAYPQVQIKTGKFEETFVPAQSADLAVIGSAFHWLKHKIALPKIAQALRPGGLLALLWCSQERSRTDPADEAMRPIFERLAPEILAVRARESAPERMSRAVPGILLGAPDFTDFTHQDFRFARTMTTRDYLGMLGTYSHFLTMENEQRAELFNQLGALIEVQFGGKLEREFRAALQLAKRS
jgi:SAM-dependent methyltransferase